MKHGVGEEMDVQIVVLRGVCKRVNEGMVRECLPMSLVAREFLDLVRDDIVVLVLDIVVKEPVKRWIGDDLLDAVAERRILEVRIAARTLLAVSMKLLRSIGCDVRVERLSIDEVLREVDGVRG